MPRDNFDAAEDVCEDVYAVDDAALETPIVKTEVHRSCSQTSSSTSESTTMYNVDEPCFYAKKSNAVNRFSFSTSTRDMRTPPPPSPPLRVPSLLTRYRKHNVFPLGWIVGTMVRDVYTAISQWVLDGLSAWFLQRSFLGNFRSQVFKDFRRRIKSSTVVVSPPVVTEPVVRPTISSFRESKKNLQVPRIMEESETNILQIATGQTPTYRPPEPAAEEGSRAVQWVIFAVEMLALIPIVVIGLSLFYILAVGIYKDVHDMVNKIFSNDEQQKDQFAID